MAKLKRRAGPISLVYTKSQRVHESVAVDYNTMEIFCPRFFEYSEVSPRRLRSIPEGNPLSTSCYNRGMRDFLHHTQSILGGILTLSLYGGVFFVAHEIVRPSSNVSPVIESLREGLINSLERKDFENF